MRNKLLVLGTYAADTPIGGGKYVAHHLYRRLATRYDVTFLSLVESDKETKSVAVSPHFTNMHIPQDTEQAKIMWSEEKKIKTGLFDVIQIRYWMHNNRFIEQVKNHVKSADVIILLHPYFANLVNSLGVKIPIVYHAIDAELNQKRSILSDQLIEDVKNVEKLACELSDQIWASSEYEKDIIVSTYTISKEKIRLLPHGADLTEVEFIDRESHAKIKSKEKNLNNKTIFVFTGSWHPPNLESLEFIISSLSPIDANYLYFVVGSVKDYYFHKDPKAKVPSNVILLGPISNEEKMGVYKLSDFAINPMFSGAGTNLKMLEYMAMGLPIISTEFGVRGVKISKNTITCKKEQFVDHISNINKMNYYNSSSISENREIVMKEYDYDLISKKCGNCIEELLKPAIADLTSNFSNVISELNNMDVRENDSIIDVLSKEIESIM